MKLAMEPVMKTQMELEAHEKECAIRYASVQEKLEALDKRMWRLERTCAEHGGHHGG